MLGGDPTPTPTLLLWQVLNKLINFKPKEEGDSDASDDDDSDSDDDSSEEEDDAVELGKEAARKVPS